MKIRAITLAVVLTATAAHATEQPRRPRPPLASGTSAIRGTLSEAETNAPVARCLVRAGSSSRFSDVMTGPDGRYQFTNIAEGSYSLMVDCDAHVWSCPPPEPGGPPCGNVMLFKDQQRQVDFTLSPAAIVRGRVIDSAGRPVPRASVRLGGPFVGNNLIRIETTVTRDDGSYELNKLPGGSWRIEVEMPPARGALRSPLVYFPGVLARDDSGLVEVVAGSVKDNVNITVPAVLERTLTVRIPPPDGTMTSVVVSLIRAEPLMTRRLELDANGQAAVRGLIDGRYIVMATAVSGQQRWADYQAVDFLEESVDVSLQLRPAGKIRGRLVAASGGLPPLDGASIGAAWVENDVILNPIAPDEVGVAADGTFEIDGMFGRRVMQLVRFDSDWRIQAVLQGRSDVSAGLELGAGATAELTVVMARR